MRNKLELDPLLQTIRDGLAISENVQRSILEQRERVGSIIARRLAASEDNVLVVDFKNRLPVDKRTLYDADHLSDGPTLEEGDTA